MPNNNNGGNLNDGEVFNSSDDFFDTLDEKVSGENSDRETQGNPTSKRGTEQVTHKQDRGSNQSSWDSEDNPYKQEADQLKKRYADSSRAGQANYNRLKEVEPFLPVLDAMKQDSGLVQHVREYLDQGGAPPKTVQEKLGLDEDFVFDGHEAMTDPNSDSGKVYSASVDDMVQKRVGQILGQEKQQAQHNQMRMAKQREALDFQQRKGLTDDEMRELLHFADNSPQTLDDIYTVKNMRQRDANIAQATKTDMLKQMKNTQGMPSSASGANSQGSGNVSDDDQMFARLFGGELEKNNLFG